LPSAPLIPPDLPPPIAPSRRPARRRKGPRSRAEVEAERRQLHIDTEREIDGIVAEFHAILPRDLAKAIGAIYARYSSRFQHSIADQVRGCLQAAVQQGVFVPRENILFDLAIRGAKQRRPGFDQLKTLLAGNGVQVLLLLTTNRLARKTYKALQFVEEEVVARGIRAIFVKSGVDTADTKRWRMLLNYHAGIDEFVSSMYSENIRVAQEGLFNVKLVMGTITFGYRGKEVPGPLTRQKRPRREYEIDPETSEWVRKIFAWYVRDRMSIAEIIRRLNEDPNAPLGPKALSGRWTRLAVKLLLANPRYRGCWQYGKTQNVWQVQADYTRQIERDQPLAQKQFDELRIVDDETWYAAARRLAEEEKRNAGRKPKDGDRRSRPRLLNGIFVCATHGRQLHVGGAQGTAMVCPECQGMSASDRPLFSQLNRVLALELTCRRLAELVRADSELVEQIVTAVRYEADRLQQPDPAALGAATARELKLSERIGFVMSNPGDTDTDRAESAVVLRRLRAERAQVQAEKATLEAARDRRKAVPTEAEIVDLLRNMDQILTACASGGCEETVSAAREIIELLTGGRIELVQRGERKAQRGWLQGRFRVGLIDAVVQKLTGVEPSASTDGAEVTIDYRRPYPHEEEAKHARKLYDQGRLESQIAAALGCGRNWVTELLKRSFESDGMVKPDGRKRRATLSKKVGKSTLPEQLADPAKALWEQGLADVQIADQLGCSPPTAVAAIRHWHAVRGLAAPSHSERRAALIDKMVALYDQQLLIRDIAREVGMCTRSVTLLLRDRFEDLGRHMADGRTRRRRPG
jgi:site-specific DNA recombinase